MRGLYVHIPFCKQICHYCDFPKKIPYNQEQINKYVSTLILEIEKRVNFNDVKTIYLGGGTPNLLDLKNLEILLKFLNERVKEISEFTIELNPELVTVEQVKLFKKYGVNRFSLGVQSFDTESLKLLGRRHTKEDVFKAINLLKHENLMNINIDLIYGFYGQTLDDFKKDLDYFKNLDIKHLSCYSLIIEENTMFYKRSEKIDDNLVADMEEYLERFMFENNFHHYEISNYAKSGYESKHNLLYWDKLEYYGCGMGAVSYLNHQRLTNQCQINKYLDSPFCFSYIENLTLQDEKQEFFMLGLRKIDGVNKTEYEKRFGTDPFLDFDFQKLVKKELIEITNETIKLTKKGHLLANLVFEEFI